MKVNDVILDQVGVFLEYTFKSKMYVWSKILARESIGEFGECMAICCNSPCHYFELYGDCVSFSAALANY